MGGKVNSLAKRMLESVPTAEPKMPERQPEARVRKAENGYVVTKMGKEGYASEKDAVYESMEGVMKCLDDHFMGKKKKTEDDSEDY